MRRRFFFLGIGKVMVKPFFLELGCNLTTYSWMKLALWVSFWRGTNIHHTPNSYGSLQQSAWYCHIIEWADGMLLLPSSGEASSQILSDKSATELYYLSIFYVRMIAIHWNRFAFLHPVHGVPKKLKKTSPWDLLLTTVTSLQYLPSTWSWVHIRGIDIQ